MGKPFEVTDENFDKKVLQADVPTLTDFWATWCGPCRMVAPIVEELAEEYDGELNVAKLDVDENPSIAMRYGVQSIPTLILFENGQEVERIVGAQPKNRMLEKVKPYLD